MKIKAIRCPRCGDVIYSRARHDFRWCTCGMVAVDGGFDYLKISLRYNAVGVDFTEIVTVDLNVNATMEELYKDWNLGIDKYGIIKGG